MRFPITKGPARPRRPRILADPSRERLATSATVVTFIRTVGSVSLSAFAAHQGSEKLLVIALAVYWVGDSLDGYVARVRDCETRAGAVLDILCDRFCCAAFYVGLAWLEPHLVPAIFVYLAEFMVIDLFISIGFLAWPITSPNYFYVVDRKLYRWNWSKPGKTLISALFAVVLLVTDWMPLGLAIALGLVLIKAYSFLRMLRIGLPIPSAPLPERPPPPPERAVDDRTTARWARMSVAAPAGRLMHDAVTPRTTSTCLQKLAIVMDVNPDTSGSLTPGTVERQRIERGEMAVRNDPSAAAMSDRADARSQYWVIARGARPDGGRTL